MIDDSKLLRWGRMFGLDKSKTAKKIFTSYLKFKMKKYYGIHQKEIQGSIMLLNLNDPISVRDLFLNGIHSYSITSCFYNEINEGMNVFDIGANIGYFTFLAAKIVGKKGKVLGIEPGREAFDIMNESLKLNNYDNVELFNQAVGDKSTRGKLFLNPDASVDNKILDMGERWNFINVQIVSLDDLIASTNINPNFIKVDVQGAEYLVLEGMKKILESKNPFKMVIEFSARTTQDKSVKFAKYLNYLSNLGFGVYYLKEPKKSIDVKNKKDYETFVKTKINDFQSIEFSKYDEVDLLFVRQ